MMKKKWMLVSVLALVLVLVGGISLALAREGLFESLRAPSAPLDDAFTYQGELIRDTTPVSDTCDMAFRLYDDSSGGLQVGTAITTPVGVVDGLFTVPLDFGATAFAGEARWLEIAVQCPGDPLFTAFPERQALTAAPYALYAKTAGTANNAPWAGLTDVPADLADGDNDTTYSAGTGIEITSDTITVTGAPWTGLTGVPAGLDDGVDNDTTYSAGDGIEIANETITVTGAPWAGLTDVPAGFSDGVDDTGASYNAGAGIEIASDTITVTGAPWAGLTGVPAGLDDGVDNDTTYSAGEGIEIANDTITVTGAPWSGLTGVPAGFGDDTDDVDDADADAGNELNNSMALVGNTLYLTDTGGTLNADLGGLTGGDIKQLTHDFVMASGESVSVGDLVSFLNGEAYRVYSDWGSKTVFNPGMTVDIVMAALSETDFVIAYRDEGNSYYGTAITGTLSGGSLTWGSESVFNPASTNYIAIADLSATDFVVAYQDQGNSGYGTAITGTPSGGSLIWGNETVFNPVYTEFMDVEALSATDLVIAYSDWGNSSYGTVITGMLNGGSLTWGSGAVFNTAHTWFIDIEALTTTDFVVAYRDRGSSSSNYGTAITGTLNGGSLTLGSETVFHPASTNYIAIAALSTTDFVIAYSDDGNSDYGTAITGTLSGGSFIWGNETVFNPATTSYVAIADLSATDFVVAYQDNGNSSYGIAITGTLSGNSLTWGSEGVFNHASTQYVAIAGLSETDFVVAYRDSGNSSYGTARVGNRIGAQRRLIGIARNAATGGQTVTVIFDGLSDGHSALTPGTIHYLQEDGTWDTMPTGYQIGLALTATELLLYQMWEMMW
ncbi:MAG: hypothetical protein GY832_04900 [Chloroflexi bacterium]|nr:hypothetical protein [Chloroflexota bacterium]